MIPSLRSDRKIRFLQRLNTYMLKNIPLIIAMPPMGDLSHFKHQLCPNVAYDGFARAQRAPF